VLWCADGLCRFNCRFSIVQRRRNITKKNQLISISYAPRHRSPFRMLPPKRAYKSHAQYVKFWRVVTHIVTGAWRPHSNPVISHCLPAHGDFSLSPPRFARRRLSELARMPLQNHPFFRIHPLTGRTACPNAKIQHSVFWIRMLLRSLESTRNEKEVA
jgi:hypothetical protein